VFAGRILVSPGADGTDAVQRSDSLLLSRLAKSDIRPELEIYADDVKCAHGATVGQIDDASLFYLRSRGLDEAYARNLLTYAFAAEALGRIETVLLRQRAARAIHALLPGGEVLGELV
jgi:Fe-S cluster assembly protein SufD